MSRRDIIGGAVAIVLVVIVAGVIVYAVQTHTCTVGVSGTAANVTYSGPQADGFCANPDRWQYGGNHFYKLDQPQGVTLCAGQVTLNGSTVNYTIRDTGVFDIVGSGLCKWYGEGLPSSP